jgi:peptide/nickel transport system permease protein
VFAYIVRRIGSLVVILLGSSFILYNLAAYSGDPLEGLRFSNDPTAAREIEVLTQQLQLDVPPPLRYLLWLKGILGVFIGQADFGFSREGQPVLTELAYAIPITVRLTLSATIIALVLGVALGIVSALRQYSRFDYGMTFIAFLFFSLPIFWVAVLLKQYLAIGFNDFLGDGEVTTFAALAFGAAVGVFWAAIISGSRRRVAAIFVGVTALTAGLIWLLGQINWFVDPKLGPIMIVLLGAGIAVGVTQLSTGIENRTALYSSLSMAAVAGILYYPVQGLIEDGLSWSLLAVLAALTVAVATAATFAFARIDRRQVLRTTIITAFLISLLVLVDRLMKTWLDYSNTDAVFGRPIQTIGQTNILLEFEDVGWWIHTLDVLTHLFLPTIALTLISFAGYVRYSRGTLLEVLNQDYIRTARAKGLTERTVIMRHAFRNTMIPLTTIIVVDFAGVVGGAIITERVFGWTGMGTLFNKAITTFDLNLLMGVFLVTGALVVLANLVADLLYSALDPRIRVGSGA